MSVEFDKEIDSLMRRFAEAERAGEKPLAGGHPDADELGAFSEGALTGMARTRVIEHSADCSRCRSIISNLVSLRSASAADESSEEEAAAGAPVVGIDIPWYRKLFAVGNLAYGLGALALIFAGIIGFIVIRTALMPPGEMAMMPDSEFASNTASDTSENSSANTNASAAQELPEDLVNGESRDSGPSASPETDIAAPPPPSADEQRRGDLEDRADLRTGERQSEPAKRKQSPVVAMSAPAPGREEVAADTISADRDRAEGNVAPKQVTELPAAKRAPQELAAGRTITNKSDDKAAGADAVAKAEEKESAETRQIEGRTFRKKDNAWYDTAYKGERTTNVRRKTAEYRALDAGLRKIGDTLEGTVVVIWRSKAYRID